jgi:glycosidase
MMKKLVPLFRVTLLAALLLGPAFNAGLPAAPSASAAVNPQATTPNPTSVTIAGSLQSELGCAADWNPACAATHLTYDAADDVWQGSFTVPTGNWEYKAALNDSWDENYGQGGVPGGDNIPLNLVADTTVKFYYDHKSSWITDNVNSTIATAVGSFQSELGCPGDWQPDCLRSWLQDLDGNGIYTFSTSTLPAGSYEFKVAINESWDENYGQGGTPGGANLPFTINVPGTVVTFSYDRVTHIPTVTLDEPGASHDNTVQWAELGHDSRDTLYRTPGGAVTTGTPVTLRLRAASGDLTAARLRVWNDRSDTQTLLDMSLAADDGTYEYWQATVPASADPTVYWYRFIAIDGTDMDFYEDDAARTGGWGEAFDESADNSWQLTVYDPAFETPDWVKDAVIYQVFPDRFRDGDPDNNTLAGTFFYDTPGGTVYRSNAANWNTVICDPRDAGGACPGAYSHNFYGGDLAGLTEQLDYLEELGVTAIYLNPVFFSPSNHGYDTSDFLQIDSSMGTQAEFEDFATAVHARGMKIILDGVFNHTSSDSIYFDRYARYDTVGACESAASPYRDWYFFQPVTAGSGPCVGDDGTPGGATYTSWFGYDSLPKLNSTNAEVRALIWDSAESVAVHWLQWADGWRLDVAGDVDPGVTGDAANLYWEGFREAVKTAKPDAYIVGEEWGNPSSWILGGEWDATMNYQLGTALLSFWRDEPLTDNDHTSGSSAGPLNPLTPQQLNERLLNLQERYPAEAFYAMMNLLDSHDTNRALFLLDENADEAGTTPELYENPAYDWSDAIARLKGTALLQMTLPGAPTIYYGDEVGLVGPVGRDGSGWQDDPYNRQPYPWLDESGTPYYTHLQSGGDREQLLAYYASLTNTRNSHAALRTGDFMPLLVDNTANVYAYGRKLADNSDAALVIVNRSSAAQTVAVNVAGYFAEDASFHDAIGNQDYTVTGGILSVPNVAASGGALLTLHAPMAAAPAAVTDLAVTAEGDGSISLGWTAASGATSYDVYRSLLSGGGYELVTNVAGTTYTDTGLTNAVTYYYVVVARDDASGLVSGYSNEAHGMPQLGIGWANLQWPPSITHTIGTAPTSNIYGQVWIDGVTSAPGATPGLRAQVGYGPDGSSPDGNPAWQWVEAGFNGQAGNNDEFVGSLIPESVGVFDYAYRYSGNNGQTWLYADLDGTGNGYDPAQAGALTVNASADTTAPGAPVLSVADWSSGFIALEWTAAADDVAVYAYDLYRSTDPDLLGERVARVLAPDLAYTDNGVVSGVLYYYRVLAVDTSFNFSEPSNQVSHLAEPKMVAVTFNLTVPDFTAGTVYIVGNQPEIGNWSPGAVPMTRVDDTHWTITLDFLDETLLQYKFARGSWETVVKGADGNEELANLETTVDYGSDGTQLVEYTVPNWRDPLVAAFSPADGAEDVSRGTAVTVTWSQAMAANTCLTLTGPAGAVDGTCSYDNDTFTITFTPAQPLRGGTLYTALVSGQVDAGGDTQQVPVTWTFTTAPVLLYLPVIGR